MQILYWSVLRVLCGLYTSSLQYQNQRYVLTVETINYGKSFRITFSIKCTRIAKRNENWFEFTESLAETETFSLEMEIQILP